MTDSFADEKGNVVSAEYYGMSPGWPKELLNSVKLEEAGKKTRLSLRVKGIDEISETDRENMRQGWEQSLDKLADYLAKAQK